MRQKTPAQVSLWVGDNCVGLIHALDEDPPLDQALIMDQRTDLIELESHEHLKAPH